MTAVSFEARDLPPLHPTDRAAREVAALPRYDVAQELASLRAQVRSLTEQLHRKEDLLAAYRRADEADDAERMTTAPTPEETTP